MTVTFWDTLMLRDELDMLEVRLTEAEGWPVRKHILVEAGFDHRGNPKPLHYAESGSRFAAWSDRIIHVVADLPDTPDPWLREHSQRTAIWQALDGAGAQPDDVVLLADVDEFPPVEAFVRLPEPAFAHEQALSMYAVDWEHPGRHLCSVTARLGWARSFTDCGRCRQPGCATMPRDARERYPRLHGGRHITWLGGIEGQRAKLNATCHTEMTGDEYHRIWDGACYRDGLHHSGEHQMVPVDVEGDESFPEMIRKRECPPSWFRPREGAV